MAVMNVPQVVESRALTAPPQSPSRTLRYIIPASGSTGAWAGKANQIAWWTGSIWKFIQPTLGVTIWVTDEASSVVWDGTTWLIAGGGGSASDTSQNIGNASGTVSPSLTGGRYIVMTLMGETVVALPSGSSDSKTEKLTFEIIQGGVGSWTIAWTGQYMFPMGVTPQLTRRAGAKDILEFTWNGTKWLFTNFTQDVR